MKTMRGVPVLGFAAYSGTGKTTLMLKLLPLLRARGHRIGVVKHAHHSFEIDYPGKDSYALRKSGARQLVISSRFRWALVCEHEDDDTEPTLDELVSKLDCDELDLILVEGFKGAAIPKIELHRLLLGHPLLYPQDAAVVAIAHDGSLPEPAPIPELDLNAVDSIADFISTLLSNTSGPTEGNL